MLWEEESWSQRRERTGEYFPEAIGWESDRGEFCEFLQLQGLEPEALNISGLGCGSTEGTMLLQEKRQASNSGAHGMEALIRRKPRTPSKEIICSSFEYIPERQCSQRWLYMSKGTV